MIRTKKILLIGIDPSFIDFSLPEFSTFPGLNADKVRAGINGSADALNQAGFEAEVCWIDLGETAVAVLEKHLGQKPFDAVMIGAGIRVPEKNFILFENLINTILTHAKGANICFNTNPNDTVAAVQRWI